MYLKLKNNFCLRRWKNYPFAINDIKSEMNLYEISEKEAKLLMSGLSYKENKEFADRLLQLGMLEICEAGDKLSEHQKLLDHGCIYFPSVIFSITGKCNYRCRHCHVSAPDAKLGEMTLSQIENHIREFKKCGLKNITLIGGEPLVHPHFLEIAEKIVQEGLFVSSIYTNGSLIDETLLDKLEELDIKPYFQMSYDGYGCHDRMRGIKGAEERFFQTVRLLKGRKYRIICSTSLTKDNAPSLLKTLDVLTENNIDKLIIYPPIDCGNWAKQPESEKLSHSEIMQVYMDFIPEYIKRGFPMDMLLYRTAIFDSKKKKYALFSEFAAHHENQEKAIVCRNFKSELNISPEEYLTPCYGLMGDENFTKFMPNINKMSLHKALSDSVFADYVTLTSNNVMEHNEKCRNCSYKRKCGGGCRTSAYLSNNDFLSYDPVMCYMLENGSDLLLKNCINNAYKKYKMQEENKC